MQLLDALRPDIAVARQGADASRALKICLVDPSLFTWPYDVRLAQGLSEIGHDAVVFGRAPNGPLPAAEEPYLRRHFYPALAWPGVRRLPGPLFLGIKGLSHVESMVRLVSALRRWRPDIIHFQWAPLAVVDKRFIGVLRRIAPTVMTVHDSAPFNNSPRAGIQRLGAIDIMRRFDRLIVHTGRARARVESYGVPARKIDQIAHGLLLDLDRSAFARAEATRTDPRVTLLLFGWIKPYKGTDVLLRAFAKLPSALRQTARVRIVGRPQMPMEPIFALTDELRIREQVEFDLRFIDDAEIPRVLEQTDIQVFPYREIDASGALMLAIAAGRPIVASNIGTFAELLEDGRHGALVEPGNSDALAAALEPLIADRSKRLAADCEVGALRDRIPSWRRIAQETEKTYRMAMGWRAEAHLERTERADETPPAAREPASTVR
jgi:glycosyltransferase involved in cell wall biosynthesis